MALTELKVKNLKPKDKRYLVGDGQGLYIAVMPTGEKYWYYRTWKNGREHKYSLGRYPDVGLKQAREIKYSYRGRQKQTPALLSAVAEDWYTTRCVPADAKRTLRNKRSRLDRLVLPQFGGRDIKSITPRELTDYLQKVQKNRGIFIGYCVKNILSQIFQYALAAGLCEWNPAAQISGALIPRPESRHYAVVRTEDEARKVLRDVDAYPGNAVVRLGLLLLAHTFVRPGEMRLAQWSELDLDGAEWRIPAERMNMGREHVVPLSPQALALFRQLRGIVNHPIWCFVLPRHDAPIGASAFCLALKRLGYGKGRMTPHGFRGMASTLLNEHGFAPDVIERQLAHIPGNTVRAAYNRAEYLDERRRMMDWWGNYLDGLCEGLQHE